MNNGGLTLKYGYVENLLKNYYKEMYQSEGFKFIFYKTEDSRQGGGWDFDEYHTVYGLGARIELYRTSKVFGQYVTNTDFVILNNEELEEALKIVLNRQLVKEGSDSRVLWVRAEEDGVYVSVKIDSKRLVK